MDMASHWLSYTLGYARCKRSIKDSDDDNRGSSKGLGDTVVRVLLVPAQLVPLMQNTSHVREKK